MTYSYDVKCAELAEHFLQDNPLRMPGDTAALAQALQDAAESYLRHDVEGRSVANRPTK